MTSPYVGLCLDVGRKAFSTATMVRLIARLADLGFTALHLHVTDSIRVGVQLPGYEQLAAGDAWSVTDVERLVAAADAVGLELVPEIDLPSHATALLAGNEHLRVTDRHGVVHPDKLDLAQPEALDFAIGLLDAAHELFPGTTMHLGGDEYFAAPWEPEDAQHPEHFPSLVADARERFGPDATALDEYAYFMNTLAGRVIEHGRVPVMWNDHVVPASANPVVPIRREIVVDVWIRWRAWTPSVEDYVSSGYRVINSNGDLLYFVVSAHGLPQPDGRRAFGLLKDTFAPRRFMGLAAQNSHIDVPPPPAGAQDPVLGASMSAWCDSPDQLGEQELMQLLDTWLVPFAAAMQA